MTFSRQKPLMSGIWFVVFSVVLHESLHNLCQIVEAYSCRRNGLFAFDCVHIGGFSLSSLQKIFSCIFAISLVSWIFYLSFSTSFPCIVESVRSHHIIVIAMWREFDRSQCCVGVWFVCVFVISLFCERQNTLSVSAYSYRLSWLSFQCSGHIRETI